MSKADSINQMLQQELAYAINREVGVPNALITVVYVRTSADLQWATVGVSVLPDNLAGTALSKLKSSASLISSILAKKTRLRQIPRLRFEFDPTERKAAVLENFMNNLDEIKKQEEEDDTEIFQF
ncbi:MAG: 30S ribosome-binding factor RbfA [Candidatus Falkowbacteria bacterium]